MIHFKNKKLQRYLTILLSVILFVTFLPVFQNMNEVQAAKNVVVVIDPGHGGTNMGTEYLGIPEKTYTLTIANYMKQELEKYDNVTIYMTRTTDIDVSLQQRADIAAAVNADYLYSLHLNLSPSHKLYGAEVWIPSSGTLYCNGVSFGVEELKELQKLGIFSRGVKTKVNGSTQKDYYGVIRACSEYALPSSIIEHCHVDHPIDAQYYASQEALQNLGIADATAVAKYFGLKSSKLGVNYGNYTLTAVPVPTGIVNQDITPPEVATASLKSYDKSTRKVDVALTGADSQSILQYYSYSFDHGTTWSVLYPWGVGNQSEAMITAPDHASSVVFQIYNLYDKVTQTNEITLN